MLQMVAEICHQNRLLNKVAIDWECSGLHDVIFNILGIFCDLIFLLLLFCFPNVFYVDQLASAIKSNYS